MEKDKFGVPVDIILSYGDPNPRSSSFVTVRCKCGPVTSQIASVQKTLKRTGSYQCKPCGLAEKRKDPTWRENIAKGTKKSWTQEKKDRQSVISKGLWSDGGFHDRVVASDVKTWSNVELRAASSVRQSERMAQPEVKAHYAALKTEAWVAKMSESIRRLWRNPSFRLKQAEFRNEGHRALQRRMAEERWSNPEYARAVSESMKKLRDNPEYCRRMTLALQAAFQRGMVSSLERTVHRLLADLDTPCITNYFIGYYEFDVFVPSHKLLIECQGEYWHSSPHVKSKDAAKNTYITDHYPDYKILYLWERDFLNPKLILSKLNEALGIPTSEPTQTEFSFNDVRIRALDTSLKAPRSYYSIPEEFLQSYHYRSYGRSAKKVYGAFLEDVLIGVVKFSGISRKESATSMGLIPKQVLELDRFCIHPNYQKKNFGSWLLSRASKLSLDEFPEVSVIQSFADPTVGHTGVLYEAANWEFIHHTSPSYEYLSPDGMVVHKKTLYGHARSHKSTESEYAERFGYSKIPTLPKKKFILRRK